MKTLVTIMALFLATAFSANAQVDKKAKQAPSETQAVRQQPDLSKQVQDQTKRMTKDLDLSAEQADQVMSENKTLYSNMSSATMDDVNSADREKMSTRTVDSYEANLQKILDDGQYKKYQTKKAEYMEGFNTAKVKKMKTK